MLEKWSLGYWLLRQYVKLGYWIFHREIVILGKENIPADKPVIFAPNHPNALNDDLSVAIAVPHQTVWLGRASLFKSSWARPFLRFLKIVPVFRIRDGKESLKGNEESFSIAVAVLQHNRALGIYPEAAHSVNRQMIPHKKAIARIVFLAADITHDTLDIQIVPVGLYYNNLQNFGRRLLVSFGKPLAATDYYPLYRQNPHNATIKLRNDLYKAILPLTLNYDTASHFEGFEAVRTIAAHCVALEMGIPGTLPGKVEAERVVASRLDNLEKNNPEAAAQLAGKAVSLISDLKAMGLRSWLVDKSEESTAKALTNTLALLITFPIFLFGGLFNIIPFAALGRVIMKRASDPIWISTFTFGLGILVFPLFYLLEMLLVSSLLPSWPLKLLFLASLPFAGKLAFAWFVMALKTGGRWRWLRVKRVFPDLYASFHTRKQEITQMVLNPSFPSKS